MTWTGDKLSILIHERDNLIDRWINGKSAEKTRILVQIMDLDEDIAEVKRQRKSKETKGVH
ncbi:MAG: hypothetical protein RO469_00715 [Thermincola sp.]|jgi:hypothetical protein|nr:hypothetical protein [Thermincola sp.]MDT3701503.1 hypothetical protein [Thermincola sp.]